MAFSLAGGVASYSAAEALETVQEYAFGTVTIDSDPRFPGAFAPHTVAKYAYRTYDCIPASAGPEFSELDLLVTAGLNARIDMAAFVRLRSFADRAAQHLEDAHQMQPDFLCLHRDEVGNDPPAGTAGRHLHQAWQQGMATPGLGIARVHKTLHHKRPRLLPLLDGKTLKPIRAAAKARGCNSWQLIHDEIHAHADQFQVLASAFDNLAVGANDVSLCWLRLYDILVWIEVVDRQR